VKSMKVLVTGATGLLGYHIINRLVEEEYDVYAAYHHTSPYITDVKWIKLDLLQSDKLYSEVSFLKPEIIIHAAACTDVDKCEMNKELAYRTNYLATKVLAEVARECGSHMVYISTDYVFDGSKGMYSEDDYPNPINYYGLTKLLGEVVVNSLLPTMSLILRTSGIYGYSPTGKKNFGINVLEKLDRGEEILAFSDQYLSPTCVRHLADKIIDIIDMNLTGFLHLAGERMSRYDFASIIAEILRVDKKFVKRSSLEHARLIAKRPKDSSLNILKASSLGISLPPVEDCIKHFIEDYRNMKSYEGR